jgi:hypothetical protein
MGLLGDEQTRTAADDAAEDSAAEKLRTTIVSESRDSSS